MAFSLLPQEIVDMIVSEYVESLYQPDYWAHGDDPHLSSRRVCDLRVLHTRAHRRDTNEHHRINTPLYATVGERPDLAIRWLEEPCTLECDSTHPDVYNYASKMAKELLALTSVNQHLRDSMHRAINNFYNKLLHPDYQLMNQDWETKEVRLKQSYQRGYYSTQPGGILDNTPHPTADQLRLAGAQLVAQGHELCQARREANSHLFVINSLRELVTNVWGVAALRAWEEPEPEKMPLNDLVRTLRPGRSGRWPWARNRFCKVMWQIAYAEMSMMKSEARDILLAEDK
ncbi:MAG: hypothetical protein M1828_005580 [Chrysothrix sp. TS-e1954]|nr:MAG: hypothetical protein M1828_005580 [Chrysothrix sp. TS-e1954]